MQEARHGRFYIYVYVDVRPGCEGKVIYVGKGTYRVYDRFRRMHSHWKRGPSKGNRLFAAVLNKIRAMGMEPLRQVISWHDEEHLAFAAEAAEIAKHKMRCDGGTLCNLTQGGEGPVGMIHSDAARLRIGNAAKQSWSDPNYVAKVNANRLAAMAEPAEKARKSEASAKNWSDPAFKAKTSTAIKAARASDECRAKTSVISAAIWSDPEKRAAASVKMKQHLQSPEAKAQRAEALRKRWADPVTRAQLMAARQKPQTA